MSEKLNVKQEKFVQGIIKGLSQRQAYKEAFGSEYDDNAIDINASKLFNSAKVKLRYEELLQEDTARIAFYPCRRKKQKLMRLYGTRLQISARQKQYSNLQMRIL